MFILTFLVYIFKIPNPNVLLLTGLAVFTSLYGYGAGITAGIIMFLYSMFFFSIDNSFIHYDALNLQKIIIVGVGTVLNVLFIGNLKQRHLETLHELEQANKELKLHNTALEEATSTDPLTGIKNRFAFRRDYSGYKGKSVYVMMLDVDDFKNINDSFGHSTGDEVLKQTGETLKAVFGNSSGYRYGGDEFLIVKDNIDEECFKTLVEEFRKRAKDIGAGIDASFNVHFSGGYVHGVVKLNDDLRLMLRHADSNLYKAKNAGKDKFVGSEYDRENALML